MFKHIPNILTIFRIIIIPVIILTFYFDDKMLAHRIGAGLFLIAMFSDFLDGYIARKYQLQSKLGIMLDPIADKLLISCILLMLVKFGKANELPCLLILSREFLVAGLREFLGNLQISVPTSRIGKIKTLLQDVSILLLLLGSKGSGIKYLNSIGQAALWITAIFTIYTGVSYIKATIKYLSET